VFRHMNLRSLAVPCLTIRKECVVREPQAPQSSSKVQPESSSNPCQYLCVTKSELAEHLRMSTRQVELLVKSGKLPRPVRLSGHPRWVLEDVREWLRSYPKERG